MARSLWKSWKVHVKLQSLFPEDVCSQMQWQKNAQGPWPPAFLTCSICISPFCWPAGATSPPQILGQGHAQLVLTEAISKTSTFVTRFDPWVYWVPWILLKVYSHPPELFFSGGWASDFFFFIVSILHPDFHHDSFSHLTYALSYSKSLCPFVPVAMLPWWTLTDAKVFHIK